MASSSGRRWLLRCLSLKSVLFCKGCHSHLLVKAIIRRNIFGNAKLLSASHALSWVFSTKASLFLFGAGITYACVPSKWTCKCASSEPIASKPSRDDGLWHEANLQTCVPYRSAEVLSVVGDIENWVNLFPWCSYSNFLHEVEHGCQYYKVHFGLSVGPVFVGDVVTYEVRRSARSLKLIAINGPDLKYCDFLVYEFTMQEMPDDIGTQVNVTLQLHARRVMYLKIWQALEKQLVNLTVSIVRQRLQCLRPVIPIETSYTIHYPDSRDGPVVSEEQS